MTRINIELPDDLHKRIKLEALKQDKTLKEFVIDTLRKNTGGKS